MWSLYIVDFYWHYIVDIISPKGFLCLVEENKLIFKFTIQHFKFLLQVHIWNEFAFLLGIHIQISLREFCAGVWNLYYTSLFNSTYAVDV